MSHKRELVSLGYSKEEVQHKTSKIPRLEDGKLPAWYKKMDELSTKIQNNSVKSNMLSEITYWETLFGLAPEDLHFMKVKEYLRTGSAVALQKIDKEHHVTLLNADGRDVIRSLLIYLRQSVEKKVKHDSLQVNMIYLNRVGEIRVKRPTSMIAKGEDNRICIETELAKWKDIISSLCMTRRGIPLDVENLLELLTFNYWSSHSSFIINHPCFWPPKKFEGVIILMRQKIRPYHQHGNFVLDALELVTGLLNWGQKLRNATFEVGKCCMVSQLVRPGSNYNEIHQSGFLIYLRDVFVHGHLNSAVCMNFMAVGLLLRIFSGMGFIVVVAEKDVIRDRGWRYYEKLKESGWDGKLEFMEIEKRREEKGRDV